MLLEEILEDMEEIFTDADGYLGPQPRPADYFIAILRAKLQGFEISIRKEYEAPKIEIT